MRFNKKALFWDLISFGATSLIFMGIMWLNHLAPFGERSLATMDASIQYLDFFSYWKDVLAGKNGFGYTFSNLLGSGNISHISYYLLSPFNLLIVFFKKSDANLFFDLVVLLKLATAALTCSIFLQIRFKDQLKRWATCLLAISYALMQYDLWQSSNIMWLDGVYLLPLELVGVYLICRGQSKGIYWLSITSGLCLIFNWYVGAINCLFTAIWLCLEIGLNARSFRKAVRDLLMYSWAMFLGILISSITFLPTVTSMSGQSRSQFDWNLFTNTFRGAPLSIVQGYTIGANSTTTRVALFCGSLVIICALALFFANYFARKEKVIFIFGLVLTVLMYYWQPFFMVFSLLKDASSYWYRYSYISSFFLIFMAGSFLVAWLNDKQRSFLPVLCSCVLYLGMLGAAKLTLPAEKDLKYGITALSCLLLVVCLYGLSIAQNKKNQFYIISGICLLCGLELSYNADLIIKKLALDARPYATYSREQEKQIAAIKQKDPGSYRISQTKTRSENELINITANYNDGYAYNYRSISSYTSSPDGKQLKLLADLGYRFEGDRITIVNTSILPTDSLLGVKYVLSPYYIKGLEKTDLPLSDGKSVYKNPYALPLAFTVSQLPPKADGRSVFEYENEVFSTLAGEKVELFKPLPYRSEEVATGRRFIFESPKGNYGVYGNLPWDRTVDGTSLDLNGKLQQFYGAWLSPSVFYVPTTNDGPAYIELKTTAKEAFRRPELYALDLDELKKAVTDIKQKSALVKEEYLTNGSGKYVVSHVASPSYLQTSIPYDDGWKVTVNGKVIEPRLFDEALMAIPLNKGKNVIQMTYQIPHAKLGILLTVIGCSLLAVTKIVYRKQSRQ